MKNSLVNAEPVNAWWTINDLGEFVESDKVGVHGILAALVSLIAEFTAVRQPQHVCLALSAGLCGWKSSTARNKLTLKKT
jgi:hypothetical protein